MLLTAAWLSSLEQGAMFFFSDLLAMIHNSDTWHRLFQFSANVALETQQKFSWVRRSSRLKDVPRTSSWEVNALADMQ